MHTDLGARRAHRARTAANTYASLCLQCEARRSDTSGDGSRSWTNAAVRAEAQKT